MLVKFKRKRRGRTGVEAIVHAKTKAAAEKFISSKYQGSTLERTVELGNKHCHFVVADLED